VFPLRPTRRQEQALFDLLRSHRDLYNAALQERRDAWRQARDSISFAGQSADLPWIRANCPGLGQWSARAQQNTLRRLNKAFQAFFRRVKFGETPGYPRFKSLARFGSVEHTHGDGSKWDPTQKRTYIQGVGHIRTHAFREVRGAVKTVTVKWDRDAWWVVLSCDDVPTEPLPKTGSIIGIDWGVTHLLTDSDGNHTPNPRLWDQYEAEMVDLQRRFAESKCQSKKLRRRIRKLWRKIGNARRDHHHKVARRLVEDHDVIFHEKLQVKNMTRSAKGTTEAPGTNVAAKSGLNRAILDTAPGMLFSILASKAEDAAKLAMGVEPRNSSQLHHRCGLRGVRKDEDFWCPSCQVHEHADTNAALNHRQRGLALLERQAA
jgi:putative transposase